MINIGGVSIRGFLVATRWARLNGFPKLIADLTLEDNRKLQAVAEEYDFRCRERNLKND